MTALDRISERVSRNGDPNDPLVPSPTLTLDEFFTGNDVVGSIAPNLFPTPEPAEVWEMLKTIEAKEEVNAIYIIVSAFDDERWPFADSLRIVSSESLSTVQSYFPEHLAPDDFWLEGEEIRPREAIQIPEGTSVYVAWYD